MRPYTRQVCHALPCRTCANTSVPGDAIERSYLVRFVELNRDVFCGTPTGHCCPQQVHTALAACATHMGRECGTLQKESGARGYSMANTSGAEWGHQLRAYSYAPPPGSTHGVPQSPEFSCAISCCSNSYRKKNASLLGFILNPSIVYKDPFFTIWSTLVW